MEFSGTDFSKQEVRKRQDIEQITTALHFTAVYKSAETIALGCKVCCFIMWYVRPQNIGVYRFHQFVFLTLSFCKRCLVTVVTYCGGPLELFLHWYRI